MERRLFFDAARRSPFGGSLTQGQVDGIDVIVDEWQRRALTDSRWLAYMLATTFHETARTMQPIREFGGADYFRRMYDIAGARPHVARDLGNTEPGDGVRFHGRGFVQLTGRSNYRRMSALVGRDLVAEPDLALDAAIATEILFEGMIGGLFTGHRLGQYFDGTRADWRGARRIVNGLDRADAIAGHGRAFHAAVELLKPDTIHADEPRPGPAAECGEKTGGWLAAFLRSVLTGGRL